MAKKGYARVSTEQQNLDRQLKQLEEEKCDVIFQEKMSGSKDDRPELKKLLDGLEEGDIVVITDLTRITRSTRHLFELVDFFRDRKANIKSLKDTWLDLSDDNPYSAFLITVMGAVAQLEKDLSKQRVIEGVAIAKAKGKYKGRKAEYTEENENLAHALELYREGKKTVKQICNITGVGRSTLYDKVKEKGIGRA